MSKADGNVKSDAMRQDSRNSEARVQFIGDENGVDGGNGWAWCDGRLPASGADAAAVLAAVVIAWFLLYVNSAAELMAVPGGSLSSIFIVYAAGTAAGRLMTAVGGLPALFGMMLAGIALRNCGLYTVTVPWCIQLVSAMRSGSPVV